MADEKGKQGFLGGELKCSRKQRRVPLLRIESPSRVAERRTDSRNLSELTFEKTELTFCEGKRWKVIDQMKSIAPIPFS